MQCVFTVFNCTTSHDSYNLLQGNWIGRWTSGDNTGASDSIGEEFAKNYVTDIMEGGEVGSTYINMNSNSSEGGSTPYAFMGNCINQNFSSFFGGYTGTASPPCAAQRGLIPPTNGSWPGLGPFGAVASIPSGSSAIGVWRSVRQLEILELA